MYTLAGIFNIIINYNFVVIALLVIVKSVYFLLYKSDRWRHRHYFYFTETELRNTSNKVRRSKKIFLNRLSITIAILSVMQCVLLGSMLK